MDLKNIILEVDKLDEKNLVTILELINSKLYIYSVSEMAQKEGKSRNGILNSNRYKKTSIGKTKLAIKGVVEDKLPI